MSTDPNITWIPLDDIDKLLRAKAIERPLYMRTRVRWLTWLGMTGQPNKPISLSPTEEASLDFIDYQLSAEEKDACEAWKESLGGDFLNCPDDVVQAGYRITFTFDDKNNCIVVTVIGRATDCPNYNKAMTTRHSNIQKALTMAMYKQIVVFDYQSWGATDAESLFG